jgi:hypothetical protein
MFEADLLREDLGLPVGAEPEEPSGFAAALGAGFAAGDCEEGVMLILGFGGAASAGCSLGGGVDEEAAAGALLSSGLGEVGEEDAGPPSLASRRALIC